MSRSSTLVVTAAQRAQLATLADESSPRTALRARIVLRMAKGLPAREVATELTTTAATVRRWWSRFTAGGVDGLRDRPRAGRPATRRIRAARMLTEQLRCPAPTRSGHWSVRALARAAGVSPSTVHRLHRAPPAGDAAPAAASDRGDRDQFPSAPAGRTDGGRADVERPPWSRPRDPGRHYFSGPRAMRALTHPARWTLLHHLQVEGAVTATDCAPLVGLSVSATAYHLHQLARYGLATPAPDRGDRRERVWRPLAPSVRMDDSAHDDPQTVQTVQQMIRASAAAADHRAQRWADAYPAESHQWRTASMFSYKALRTTPAELGTLFERFANLLQSYQANRRPAARAPAGARLVHLDIQMFPREDPVGAGLPVPP